VDQIDRSLTDWLVWIGRQLPDADIATHYTSCFGIAEGRNDIVRDFLKYDCTHLWMIDADTVPPYSLGLLDHDLPVVCGPYQGWRGNMFVWHVYAFVETDRSGVRRYIDIPHQKWPKERVFKADAAGTGCMLIRRDVLEQARDRPFFHTLNPDGTHGTEEFAFCQAVGGVWVDQRFHCEHYRDLPISQVARAIHR
jgi:hypothetical protein